MPPFNELTITLFGKPGTGKTRFAAGDPDVLVVCTEPGAEMLRARKWPQRDPETGIWEPPTWAQFVGLIDQIENKAKNPEKFGQLQIKAVAIDIVDGLYQACQDWVCVEDRERRKLAPLEYAGDAEDHGKTWGLVKNEWKKQLNRLMGIVRVRFLTHSEEQQVEIINQNKLKEKITRISATFSGGKGGRCGQHLDGIVNAMGYLSTDGNGTHTITFRQEAGIGAKDRTDILAAMGTIDLPGPNESWQYVCDAYEKKAIELGFKVQSMFGGS